MVKKRNTRVKGRVYETKITIWGGESSILGVTSSRNGKKGGFYRRIEKKKERPFTSREKNKKMKGGGADLFVKQFSTSSLKRKRKVCNEGGKKRGEP